MSRAVFILACFALFLGICALNVSVNRPRIERDLIARTTQALEKKPYVLGHVRFEGRDGAVVIEEPAAVAGEAKATAESVFGVRVAGVTARQRELPGFRAERTTSGLRLKGTLPEVGVIEAIASQAKRIEPDKTVNEMTTGKVQKTEYLGGLPATLAWLARVDVPSSLELRERVLILEGSVADEFAKSELESNARAQTPAGLTFESRLIVPTRVTTAVAPPPEPVPELGADFKTEIESRLIHFEFDSVELAPGSRTDVEPLAKFLKAYPNVVVKVIGYCDIRGTLDYNRDLGTRRAEEIKGLLILGGVAAKALVSEGRGAIEFIADNKTEAGMAKNRRVEFRVVKGP